MSGPLRVGVVGMGIGQLHLLSWLGVEGADAVAFAEPDDARREKGAADWGLEAVRTLDELLELDLDIIDLCTPPHLHEEQVIRCLEAGRHVICEKPLVDSVEACERLEAAAAAATGTFMPIFQYRFGHGAQKLKLLIDAGVAGTPYLTTVETAWRRRPEYYAVPWRGKWATELGGGTVTLAIHNHDLLTYLLGPVRRVFARTKTLVNPIETEDTLTASVEMADGSLASLSLTTGSSEEISRHRFCFSGLVAESNTRPYTSTHEPWKFIGDTPEKDAEIQARLECFEPLPERFPGQFYRFYHALRDLGSLPVTLQDARASLEFITALYYSADTGQDVELPIGPDHPYYGGWMTRKGS